MKLINKISFLYLINTVIVFVIGMFAIYFAVDRTISSQINGELRDAVRDAGRKIKNGIIFENPPLLEIKKTEQKLPPCPAFKDTSFYFHDEHEFVDYREYSASVRVNGEYYKITARASLIERDDLFWAILFTMGGIMALLLLILLFVNRRSTKKIFTPFYKNLKELESFTLHENKTLKLNESSITEFKELNGVLDSLSGKALKEYNALKEFTEDLSHELQTPVAVIKSKLELVLQKDLNDNEVVEFIKSAYQSITRLDKLNRSLVLLAKLETKELFSPEKINLAEKVKKAAEEFSEIAAMKGIKFNSHTESSFEPLINDNLMDVVLSNLLSNAIKHNIDGGEISIDLTGNILLVKNTGTEPKQSTDNYFERFSYETKTENSLGLGLAITKKICDLYNFKIEYTYNKPFHIITLNLK